LHLHSNFNHLGGSILRRRGSVSNPVTCPDLSAISSFQLVTVKRQLHLRFCHVIKRCVVCPVVAAQEPSSLLKLGWISDFLPPTSTVR
jgi:hypothetical protein